MCAPDRARELQPTLGAGQPLVQDAGVLASGHGLLRLRVDLARLVVAAESLAYAGQGEERVGDLNRGDAAARQLGRAQKDSVGGLEVVGTIEQLPADRQRLGRHDEARRIYEEARKAVARCEDPGILNERLVRAERGVKVAPRPRVSRTPGGGEALSESELSVLRLLRSELSQREIAGELHLSFNTIKTHTRNIYRKLDVAERAEAVARARELSLI